MTTPTQPPDPRVERIAKALAANKLSLITSVALARVLVEELGGREGSEPVETADPRISGWMEVCIEIFKLFPTMHTDMRQIPVHSRQAAAIRQLAAQQRENAETINALRERAETAEGAMHKEPYRAIRALECRVETAEAANTELDNARKSAEQSARDLRENNATLRAGLDAIKGAQVPYRWTVVVKDRMSFTFTSLESAQTWANGEGGEVVPLYRHPAPALPVVGACVVRDTAIGPYVWDGWPQDVREEQARKDAKVNGGAAYRLYRDVTPLPTEGGK